MPPIVMYTKSYCPYCHAAKDLLEKKAASFEEIDVTRDPEGFRAMVARAGGRTTVPQIFIGDTFVGGCDDLYALEARGKLDGLLAA